MKKILLMSVKDLGEIVRGELRKLKKAGVEFSEEELKGYFGKVFRNLLDEHGVGGLAIQSRYGVEFIYTEGSFGFYVQNMYGKRKFSDLLDPKFLKSMGIRESYGLIERLAMRFGLMGMDEVIRKCRKEDKRSADDVWCVYSEKGRLLGRAKTKEGALKRLRQVEYFKKKGKRG
jgi:hypothetical protein